MKLEKESLVKHILIFLLVCYLTTKFPFFGQKDSSKAPICYKIESSKEFKNDKFLFDNSADITLLISIMELLLTLFCTISCLLLL